jgi:alkylresorcinol/alkylpyrone synthase
MTALLTRFRSTRPRFQVSRARPHTWLAAVPAEEEQVTESVDGDCVTYDLPSDPRAAGAGARTRLIGEIVDRYFAASYAEDTAPDELIHVTCGGYLQPSGAQRLVATRAWDTRVTHAYRLGGHAAVPAIQTAASSIGTARRVDIAHTELSTLTCGSATPAEDTTISDGMIRYSMVPETAAVAGLRVLGIHHRAVVGVVEAMTSPATSVIAETVASALRGFVRELFAAANVDLGRRRDATFAVHPSDAWVIDRVIDVLMLRDGQLAASRDVVRARGNMLSATMPHIWMNLLADPAVASGTLIPSIAFGPGMTMWGALLEKK